MRVPWLDQNDEDVSWWRTRGSASWVYTAWLTGGCSHSPLLPPLSILLFPPIPVPPLPPFLSKYHRPLVSFFSSPASFQFSPVRYSPGTLYFTTAARAYRETTARKEVEKKVFKGARIRVRRV